jgi:NAD(P)-dependent dehydrogenase (short-subunit alcohol dehydrogenase family)
MSKTFGAESTTDEVLEGVSLSGKRVLVTGVSAGLGVETARALAAHGAEVVGAARNLAKAKDATAPVRADAANGGSLELVELDLASLASVRACADALVANREPFWPRWLAPNWVSNPSAVLPNGQAMTPALAMTRSNGLPSSTSASAHARTLWSDARSSSTSSSPPPFSAAACTPAVAALALLRSRTAPTTSAP